MYWADLKNSKTLEQCPFKSRKKKLEWLNDYFIQCSNDDEQPIFEPLDIITILEWLDIA